MTSTTPGAVIVVSDSVASERFCGRTLIERHAEHLGRAGVTDIRVVASSELDEHRTIRGDGKRTLLVTAERLFDPRLYLAAVASDRPVRITDAGTPVGLELLSDADARDGVWGVVGDGPRARCEPRGGPCETSADVRAVTRARSAAQGMAPIDDARASVATIDLRTLDAYSVELRRSVRPYWMPIAGIADRPAVTRVLVEASGKGHQDLPAMIINAPLEKAAMRVLANTRVTPNQITALCNVLAYTVAALLATGHFVSGAIGALVVGVVDGLDGRQARVQLRATPLGRLEHLLDKVYEVVWLVALTYALSGGFADQSYVAALLAWVAAYLLDSAAYDVVKRRTGVTLDEGSPLDARIRLVAGRRNVYACMLLAGALVGQADAAFGGIVWWAVVTAIVHAIRAALLIRGSRSRVLV